MWGAGADKNSLLTRLCNDIDVPLAAKILHHDTEAMHIVASLAGELSASCRSLQNSLRDCRFEVTFTLSKCSIGSTIKIHHCLWMSMADKKLTLTPQHAPGHQISSG